MRGRHPAPGVRRPGLRAGALGLLHTLVIGVAGTAPAYTISATMASLVGAAGMLAPASLLLCGLVMFGITFAYVRLNRMEPNAGAVYSWVSRIFGETVGYSAGWSLLFASALFMVSATLPAAEATLQLAAPALAGDAFAVTAVAIVWLLAVSAVLVRGVEIAGTLQALMTAVEFVLLGVIAIAVLRAPAPAAGGVGAMFAVGAFTPASFSAGALIALYFYWGWDIALSVNEETRKPARNPGVGAILAMLVLMAVFIGYAVLTLRTLPLAEIRAAGGNLLFALADRVMPRPWGTLAILALMLSTLGSLQTSILQFSRTLYAKARDGVAHPRWVRLHPRWHTPAAATLLNTGLGIVLLLLSLFYADANAALEASISAMSVQAAYYFGLAGFACAWRFRRTPTLPGRVFLVAWPAASAALLWGAALLSLAGLDRVTLAFAVGGIAGGFAVALLRRRPRL